MVRNIVILLVLAIVICILSNYSFSTVQGESKTVSVIVPNEIPEVAKVQFLGTTAYDGTPVAYYKLEPVVIDIESASIDIYYSGIVPDTLDIYGAMLWAGNIDLSINEQKISMLGTHSVTYPSSPERMMHFDLPVEELEIITADKDYIYLLGYLSCFNTDPDYHVKWQAGDLNITYTYINVTQPDKPLASGFISFMDELWVWFKGLFGWIA